MMMAIYAGIFVEGTRGRIGLHESVRPLAWAVVLALGIVAPARGDDGTAMRSVIKRSSPAVVKLYGPAAGREHGYGTGVIVSTDGKILTTLSLLVTGRNIRVVTADGRRFDGQLLRSDEARQLALLQIDAENLPYLTPAPSVELQIGDAVLALSNYFKIADGDEAVSVCRGILSSKLAALSAKRLAQEFEYTGPAIVYDALTANPGSPGGPVLDLDGRFVGMIGKIVEAAATNTRLNYAIPGEVLAEFLGDQPAPKPGGKMSSSQPSAETARSYVGIKLSELGFHHVSAYVERVRAGSPAAQAGIKADDLIVAIDSKRIADAEAFQKAVEDLIPGQTAQFTVKRGTQVIVLRVVVGEQP